jgi:hypothetical protein
MGRNPAKTDSTGGIDVTGHPDAHSLSTRGWTRAAYLVDVFATDSTGQARLPRPSVVYASGQGIGNGEGARPRETVGPLAAALNIPINTTFSRGQEAQLAQRAAAQTGPALICWQHGSIPAIGTAFTPTSPATPAVWPDERHDVVWTFTATDGGLALRARSPSCSWPETRTAVSDEPQPHGPAAQPHDHRTQREERNPTMTRTARSDPRIPTTAVYESGESRQALVDDALAAPGALLGSTTKLDLVGFTALATVENPARSNTRRI